MSKTIRVAFEIAVEKGDEMELAIAINEARDQILGFAADTIIPASDQGEGAKIHKLGAEVHIHQNNGDYCSSCRSQSGRGLYPA